MSCRAATTHNLRVLVVDDDLDTVETTATLLTMQSFRVMTATDGATALRIAAAEAPHVVLSDIRMPGMDGFQLLERLRVACPGPLLVIAITGCTSDAELLRAEHGGFDLLLRKPVAPSYLIKVLNQFARTLTSRPVTE